MDIEPDDHGIGRSRGGLSTKVHLSCEQGQKPLSVVVTAGQRGDSPQFTAVLERISVPRSGRGRARTRPDRVLADKAYASPGQPCLPAPTPWLDVAGAGSRQVPRKALRYWLADPRPEMVVGGLPLS